MDRLSALVATHAAGHLQTFEVVDRVAGTRWKRIKTLESSNGCAVASSAPSMFCRCSGTVCNFGQPGGRVAVSFRRDAGFVRIDVDDDGLGVPEDARSGLFQPFNRLGREQSGIEGTGLGLSIVWRLARAMGGRVTYEPLDKGSRFSIWLPSP